MTDTDDRRLERGFERLERELPHHPARWVRWLRDPAARWVRVPAGILLMLGGVFSILPVFGLWMLPLGAMLLAIDVPFLKRPVGRLMVWGHRHWDEWRRGNRRPRWLSRWTERDKP